MNEKLIFWAVIVWMVGMLALGIIAVKEVWKDAISAGNEDNKENEKNTSCEKTESPQPGTNNQNQTA